MDGGQHGDAVPRHVGIRRLQTGERLVHRLRQQLDVLGLGLAAQHVLLVADDDAHARFVLCGVLRLGHRGPPWRRMFSLRFRVGARELLPAARAAPAARQTRRRTPSSSRSARSTPSTTALASSSVSVRSRWRSRMEKARLRWPASTWGPSWTSNSDTDSTSWPPARRMVSTTAAAGTAFGTK